MVRFEKALLIYPLLVLALSLLILIKKGLDPILILFTILTIALSLVLYRRSTGKQLQL